MIEQLKKIGQLKTKKSTEIKKSKISLGFEKLDRDLFDPTNAYDAVAETGVKWARIQSGWQRTETYNGETSFKIKINSTPLDVKLIDMLDGSIYELDSEHFVIEDGYYRFKNIPITDSPLLITFGDF